MPSTSDLGMWRSLDFYHVEEALEDDFYDSSEDYKFYKSPAENEGIQEDKISLETESHTLSSLYREISHLSNFGNSSFANFLHENSIGHDEDALLWPEEELSETEIRKPKKREVFNDAFS